MRRARFVSGVVLGLALATPARAQQPASPAAAVHVETSVSRTAVWVGDRVTYTVTLHCAARVEIVSDDLLADRLQTSGLEFLDVTADRESLEPDRVVHRVRYTFATYRIDGTPLTIAAFPVRYFVTQPGVTSAAGAPAGEVRIPALSLALRSTIDEADAGRAIRDGRPLLPVPRRLRLAGPAGLGLLLLAAAPVALWGLAAARRLRRTRAPGHDRLTRKQIRASLESLKALDVRTVEARRDAYAQLDAWVRQRMTDATGVEAAALTPPELLASLPEAEGGRWLDAAHAVVVECERAKYAADPSSAERWPALLAEAEQFLIAPGR